MLTAARMALALLTLMAIGYQLRLHVAAAFSVLNFFSYFTNLSNLFAASVLALSARWPAARWLSVARYVSAVNMAIVGLVFAVLLRDVDLGTLRPWVNVVVHYVMPVAVVLDWLAVPPPMRLSARQGLLALVGPLVYLGYVLVRGAGTGWYPYPFLNPSVVDGYLAVAAYATGITLTFLAASWALRALGVRRSL